MKNSIILTIFILVTIILSGCNMLQKDVRYECQVSVRPTSKEPCNFVGGKDNICQLYGTSIEPNDVPDYCFENCLEKSKFLTANSGWGKPIDPECIKVSLAHSGFANSDLSPEERRIITKNLAELRDDDRNDLIESVSEKNQIEETEYVGEVTYKQGRVLIERGIDILPVVVGTKLKCDDVFVVEEDSKATLLLNGTEVVKITQPTKYTLPRCDKDNSRTSKISLFFGGLWVKLRNLVQGESYEIPSKTNAVGVRG